MPALEAGEEMHDCNDEGRSRPQHHQPTPGPGEAEHEADQLPEGIGCRARGHALATGRRTSRGTTSRISTTSNAPEHSRLCHVPYGPTTVTCGPKEVKMLTRLPRHRGLLAIPIMLFGTSGVLVGTLGLPLGASTACACQGGGLPAFQLGPNNAETGRLVIEPGERKEFTITNRSGEEVAIRSWVITNEVTPMTVDEEMATANNPRCTPRARLAAGALCYFRVINIATRTGGRANIKLEADGDLGWRTEIEAF
jgi:hypothetical protein